MTFIRLEPSMGCAGITDYRLGNDGMDTGEVKHGTCITLLWKRSLCGSVYRKMRGMHVLGGVVMLKIVPGLQDALLAEVLNDPGTVLIASGEALKNPRGAELASVHAFHRQYLPSAELVVYPAKRLFVYRTGAISPGVIFPAKGPKNNCVIVDDDWMAQPQQGATPAPKL